jgi:hypothetical protein
MPAGHATNRCVSIVAAAAQAASATAHGPAPGPDDAARAEHAWRAMRGMDNIQFDPVPPPPPEVPYVPPHWLKVALDALDNVLVWINDTIFMPLGLGLARSGQVILVLVLLTGAVALAWLAWGVLWPWWQARRARTAAMPEWAPAPEAALALLEDADALAAQGRYAEAVHLLLQRSVADIAAVRPDWLAPSSTAREIAALQVLPGAARTAFATMADEVERARYALRAAGLNEWQRARGAYAAFALERLGSAA